MFSKEAMLARINEMPIGELVSKLKHALDESHIEYEEDRGRIVWDGLPMPDLSDSTYVSVTVPAKETTGRSYYHSFCATTRNADNALIAGYTGRQPEIVAA